MKKLFILWLSLGVLFSASVFSQTSTTVSITAQDLSGQVWANGSISYIFQNAPGFNGTPYWGNSPLPPQYMQKTTIALDNSGSASFSVPTSTTITPAGSSWKYTICPNASAACVTQYIPAIGTSQDISSTVNPNLNPILIDIQSIPRAYENSQIRPVVGYGGIYYNTTSKIPMYFDGANWQTFGGCGIGLCLQSTASENQTVTQTNGSGFYFVAGNCELCTNWTFTNTLPFADNPSGAGQSTNAMSTWLLSQSGPGKNIGNAGAGWGDFQGWITSVGDAASWYNYRAGINQYHGLIFQNSAAGDSAVSYTYGRVAGGQTDASGEGSTFFVLNGTEEGGHYIGYVTSTTGTGDRAPVLATSNDGSGHTVSGPIHLIGDGYLIDTSHTVTTGTLTGLSTLYNDGVLDNVASVPVSNTLTPNTTKCTIIPNIPQSTVLTVPQSQSFTCNLASGPALTTGHAWIINNINPEQINITSVTLTGGVENVTATLAQAHPGFDGTYYNSAVWQDPTYSGCLVYDDDKAMYNNTTDFIVFGALDSSHLLMQYVVGSAGNSAGMPYPGIYAERVGSSYHVYPCAQIKNLQENGMTITSLEVNNVPWAVGDTVESPHPSSQEETMAEYSSTLNTASNINQISSGLRLNFTGAGISAAYAAAQFNNMNSESVYVAGGGRLYTPIALLYTGDFSPLISVDYLPGNGGGNFCGSATVGTFLCLRNINAHKNTWNLFDNQGTGSIFTIDEANNIFYLYMHNSDGTPAPLEVPGGFSTGYNMAGNFLRNNGSEFVPGTIQATDLPLATSTTVGGVVCGTGTTCNTGVLSVNFPTGVTASGSACTITNIVNGVVIAATCTP